MINIKNQNSTNITPIIKKDNILSLNNIKKETKVTKLLTTEITLSKDEKDNINTQIKEGLKHLTERSVFNEFITIGTDSIEISRDSQVVLTDKIGVLLNSNNNETVIDNLMTLKNAVNNISANNLMKNSISGKVLNLFGLSNYAKKMKTAIIRYEDANKIITDLVKTLSASKGYLTSNITALLELGDTIILQQEQVERDLYALNTTLNNLELAQDLNETQIGQVRQAIKSNIKDLTVLKEVNNQYLLTIDQTCENSRIQMQSVDRACGITIKLSMVGFMIRSAIENNKRVGTACKASQDFLSEQLVHNAKAFSTQTKEVMELRQSSIVDLDKLTEAHDIMAEAIQESLDQTKFVNSTFGETMEKLNKLSAETNDITKSVIINSKINENIKRISAA